MKLNGDLLWRNSEQIASDILLILSTDQQCMVFMVSDNYLDRQFQFVKDMLL